MHNPYDIRGICRKSLPPRGAWIEIYTRSTARNIKFSRSPHGERGLKSPASAYQARQVPSLPPRGAWIEILW